MEIQPYITEWRFKFEPKNILRGTVSTEPSGCNPGKYTVSWQQWIAKNSSDGHYEDHQWVTTHDSYEEAVAAMEEQYPVKKKIILEGLDRSPFQFYEFPVGARR